MRKKLLNATTVLWAAIHVVLILFGLLIINMDWFSDNFTEELSMSVGASVMATGIVGVFLFLYMALSESTRRQLQAINDAGIEAIYNYRSVRIKKEYDIRLAKAKKIDVVGYGLGSFFEDYAQDFPKWSTSAKVRIVAIDPSSPDPTNSYADLRDLEEGRAVGKTRADVERLIKTVTDNHHIKKENFEVRVMSAIPSLNVMIIDDEIFWGPYLLAMQSRNTFTCVVKKGGFLYDSLSDHFETLWNKHTNSPEAI